MPAVDDSTLERSLLDRERARRAALVAGDREALAELLADELVHVHTTGSVQSKTELLHHALEFLEFLDVARGPLNIHRLGPDAAVMTGSMTNTVRRRGHDEQVQVAAFVTQVWIHQSGAWRVLRFHATRVADSQ